MAFEARLVSAKSLMHVEIVKFHAPKIRSRRNTSQSIVVPSSHACDIAIFGGVPTSKLGGNKIKLENAHGATLYSFGFHDVQITSIYYYVCNVTNLYKEFFIYL